MTAQADAVPTAHKVRDGSRILAFEGTVVAAVTSQRMGAPRWSELVVYRLRSGEWILSKIGRSTVAHRPNCSRVRWGMPSWLDAGEEARIRRVPCRECLPVVGNGMDPLTRLESSRHKAYHLATAIALVDMLVEGREPGQVPRLVSDLLLACAAADQVLAAEVRARYASADSPVSVTPTA